MYHKTDQILDFFKKVSLKVPSRMRYEEIPDPESELSLPVITITDFATGEAGKEVLLLVGGEHARELITAEIAAWLGRLLTGTADEMASWPAMAAATALARQHGWAKSSLAEWGDALLTHVVFKIIPVENIQGRKAVESGDACLRKTAAGVDLNRNWAHAWRQAEAGSEEYGGPKPFSEPESRVVRLVAETARPQAYVALHSGEYALYAPWDSEAALAPDLPDDLEAVLGKLNTYCQCMHGAAGAVAGYLAYGSSMDYMYTRLQVRYPLTFEVYGPDGLGKTAKGGHPRRRLAATADAERTAFGTGGGSAGAEASADCIRDYNPTTPAEYQEVVSRWLATLLVLADHLAAHPAASAAADTAGQDGLPLPQTPPTKQDLALKGETGVAAVVEKPTVPAQNASVAAKAKRDWLSANYALPLLPSVANMMQPAQVGVAQAFETARSRGGVRVVLAAGAVAAAGLLVYFGWRKLGGAQLLGGGFARRRACSTRRPVRYSV
ncbi:hypothetical protein WJX81_006161 [Elliptochloris bilobata]|uniref:Peptidase M14 domain-containing protein n=1 Tax=Elliptochloris bilobata TaxID=381761 RepID=A0AAW1S3T8_9CHLO